MNLQPYIAQLLTLTETKNWREVLNLNSDSCEDFAKLLWVWPNEENLCFIKQKLEYYNTLGINSIGCGCGLLEWILLNYLCIPIIGYEVNKEWWTSKYSMPLFIPHVYQETPTYESLNHSYALLFCYFNNRSAFCNYLKCYQGKTIIIIGPGKGRGTHTDPTPFGPDFPTNDWKLDDYQEVKNTKDYIAIYHRT